MTAHPPRHGRSGRSGHRGQRGTGRRRWIIAGGLIVLLMLLGTGGVLAAVRYLPALDDARTLNVDLERLVGRALDAGLGLDRSGLTAMKADLAAARNRFDRLDDLVATDPVVALARALPPSRDAVVGADAIANAGRDFLDAADAGVALADRYVSLRERQAATTTGATGEGGSLAGLVELMATGRAEIDRMVAALDRAETDLAKAPSDLPDPLAQVRAKMQGRLDQYGPALRTFAQLDATLPAVLGWDRPKRYLVLTQNPAELRPTGGYIGSFGTITFDKGRITERKFQDVFLLDLPWDFPFVKPPPALTRYLLGPKQPWQLADANWSPDFPTSAKEAINLYRNEGGSGSIDGVLGINTYTIDELLAVTGPVSVPTYGVTVASGETTLKTLQNTRISTAAATNRKAFLSAFADRLLDALIALPPARWSDLASHGEQFRSERLFLAWLADANAQASIVKLGLDGGVRADTGDFVYPVDSNVSPVSKLNAVTDRELDLDVRLDQYGNALNELTVHWTNRIDTPEARPYRDLPTLEGLTTLGMYFRLLVPERSRVETISAGTQAPISLPADVEDVAGRTVISNYFPIPPGSARLSYGWTSPYPADLGEDGIVTYRLTIQKQPGLRPGPIRLRITIPAGATVIDASPGLAVGRESVTVDTTFNRDIDVVVRYRPAPTGG